MFFTHTTFIGIDPTAGHRPFTYVAIDSDRRLLALGQGELGDILAFVGGQHQAFVAVCAPRRPNLGLMDNPEVRQQLSPAPHPGRWTNFRLAEYLLRQHNITCPKTPAREEDSPNWMRMGFTLHRRIESLGYQTYPAETDLQSLEVYPHAFFCALLGMIPFPKDTFEGRIQRQLVLYEQELRIPDPMDLFEEITRHRLLQGVLPLKDLYNVSELDALAAAYTAWLVATHPEQTLAVGDPEEGQIILPVAELKIIR